MTAISASARSYFERRIPSARELNNSELPVQAFKDIQQLIPRYQLSWSPSCESDFWMQSLTGLNDKEVPGHRLFYRDPGAFLSAAMSFD